MKNEILKYVPLNEAVAQMHELGGRVQVMGDVATTEDAVAQIYKKHKWPVDGSLSNEVKISTANDDLQRERTAFYSERSEFESQRTAFQAEKAVFDTIAAQLKTDQEAFATELTAFQAEKAAFEKAKTAK